MAAFDEGPRICFDVAPAQIDAAREAPAEAIDALLAVAITRSERFSEAG